LNSILGTSFLVSWNSHGTDGMASVIHYANLDPGTSKIDACEKRSLSIPWSHMWTITGHQTLSPDLLDTIFDQEHLKTTWMIILNHSL
jgi:hypothetical protein